MKEVYVIFDSERNPIAALATDGNTELALEKALNSYHDGIDGFEISDLKLSHDNMDGTQFWSYTAEEKEEITITPIAFYRV